MRIYLLLCVFWFLSISAPGQAKEPTDPLTLFTVGKTTFNTDEFLYTFRKNHQKNSEGFSEKEVNEYLDLLVIFKLKVAEARERGLDTTAKFNTEFKTYREELKKPYRTEPDALDKLTKETYQQLTEEVRVIHILITLKPDALPADTLAAYQRISDLKKRVEAGESIEKLAAEYSEDPSAKYNNGNLGYFTALQMVYPFEEAAYKTPVGQLSLVRTQFGYHLIKVKDKKPASGEVEVSHILLRTGTANDEMVKSTIFTIYDQLKGGRNWDEVCKEYSEDANTKDAGGKLRPFGIGALPSVPEFEAVAFSLQNAGDVSDPFQSGLGWHIIRLEKKIPLPSYKEMEASLKRRVGRDERLQLSQQALNEKRKKEYGFVEEKSVKQTVFALADSSLLHGAWKNNITQELAGQKLFSVSENSFIARDFSHYVLANQKISNLSPSAYMNQLYESFVEESILNAEEDKLKRENPDFKNLLTEYYEGILLFEIMEKEVWNKSSIDSAGQRKYYESNKDKYQAGDRVEARIFTAQDKSLIDDIKTKISQGDTLKEADLRKFKSIQNFRAYEKKDSKIVDKISWLAGLNETEADGLFYIVEVKRLIPPGLKTFEEARSQVISDYQDYLEKNWVAELGKKYPVKINRKGKKFVLTELTKK